MFRAGPEGFVMFRLLSSMAVLISASKVKLPSVVVPEREYTIT